MSTKRTAGSGPVLDHEPSFDTEFDVSDEALNARPDARARASRRPPKPAAGGSKLPVALGAGAALVIAAVAGFLFLGRRPEPPKTEALVTAPAAPSDPAPVAAPDPVPVPVPKPSLNPTQPPVTKVAPVTLSPGAPDDAPAKPAPKSTAVPRERRAAEPEASDTSLDSALAKLGQLEAPPVAPKDAPPAPTEAAPAADPGTECDAGKAEACVTFGKKLAAKDFNAALTAFERGCALGSNKGCLEGTRLAEKAGGGEKARELSSIACGRGSATGCRLLASLYQRGVGGAPDPEKAKTFYTKACEAGDTAACGQ